MCISIHACIISVSCIIWLCSSASNFHLVYRGVFQKRACGILSRLLGSSLLLLHETNISNNLPVYKLFICCIQISYLIIQFFLSFCPLGEGVEGFWGGTYATCTSSNSISLLPFRSCLFAYRFLSSVIYLWYFQQPVELWIPFVWIIFYIIFLY